jgi:hypothetical protein
MARASSNVPVDDRGYPFGFMVMVVFLSGLTWVCAMLGSYAVR